GIVDLTSEAAQKPVERRIDAEKSLAARLPTGQPTSVAEAAGQLWALTTAGAFSRDLDAAGPAFERVFPRDDSEQRLTRDRITTLARAPRGDLWVGYFDRGVDILNGETGERLSHLEDDRVREVNFIATEAEQDRMMIATSRGLVITDGRSRRTVLTSGQNGLVNDSIAHVSVLDEPFQSNTGAGSMGRS